MASQIRFEPHGVDGLVASGTSITAAAERLGVAMALTCGGVGECTSCAVRIADGPFSLSPLTDAERRLLSESDVTASMRLGCQAKIGDADCTIHVLDAAERPPMPDHVHEASNDADAEDVRAKGSSKESGWFGFDPWSWTASFGKESAGCPTSDTACSDATSSADSEDRSHIDDARRRILDAFAELPAGERLATAFELNMKAATDFFGSVFDGPLKAGEEALDSLMKQAASVVRDAKKRDEETASGHEPPTDSEATNRDQDTDRP